MTKLCPICEYAFKDGEKIVAVMLSTYKSIASDVHFAIMQPTQCLEIVHSECYDWEDRDDAPGGMVVE